MSKAKALKQAMDWLNNVAQSGLRPVDARLYSHHSRIRSGQPGLPSWKANEAMERLQDAAQLIHAGLFLRKEQQPEWMTCILRAGEILEWLSNPAIAPAGIPVRMLAGAAYWLAGYPARAGSMLDQPATDEESEVLRAFLKGDFHSALRLTRTFWERSSTLEPSSRAEEANSLWVLEEVVRCLGLLCADIRWGDDGRSNAAMEKLDAISSLLTIERDPFSWLLARLTTECATETKKHAWRTVLAAISSTMPTQGQVALDRYARLNCIYRRATAWPSQEDGIRRLSSPGSFALCTPTGSGKTSVAEIALLQALFGSDQVSPLCLYLVPSRALAAEVESKLTRILRRINDRPVVVTGLYGGTDWGPTDAWLTSDEPTVLICTYEKGEALIRFLGPLFLGRMTLAVFDEAHTVQFNGQKKELQTAESRSLRLESLVARIRHLVPHQSCRLIALSAVAIGLEEALHAWVGASDGTHPVKTIYRSTRQLVGRLEVTQQGHFAIFYDFLDGAPLAFTQESDATPYVPSPIAPCPRKPAWIGSEKSLRPALLWAALHLASADESGAHHAVLVSITQKISGVAKDFLELLERHWVATSIPSVKREPTTDSEKVLWSRTEAVCIDYFGEDSYEYKLLAYGIVLHHSSLPKSLGRLFVDVVQAGLANVVVATSTLSEGVNIPVETVLLPSLLRCGQTMDVAEFRNLAGRAGRPGVSTEGRVLVLVRPNDDDGPTVRYAELKRKLLNAVVPATPKSPTISAIYDIWEQWCRLARSRNVSQFLHWLETTSLNTAVSAAPSVEGLDGLLLAGIVEHEEIRALTDWEATLRDLWRGIFASTTAEAFYLEAFLARGRGIPQLYPDRAERRQIYKTGLPPSTAMELLIRLDSIHTVLKAGAVYAEMDAIARYQYVESTVDALSQIERFRPQTENHKWQTVLKWWLQAPNAEVPNASKVADWHSHANSWFSYRYCWGLGSVIGVTYDRVHGGELKSASLDEWQNTGLPWIVFWLKELVTWGTLEPVVAFLLSKSIVRTRAEATALVPSYYGSIHAVFASDPLDPRAIRDWSLLAFPESQKEPRSIPRSCRVEDVDSSIESHQGAIRVMPVFRDNKIEWIDSAGFVLGSSSRRALKYQNDGLSDMDFIFDPGAKNVRIAPYI